MEEKKEKKVTKVTKEKKEVKPKKEVKTKKEKVEVKETPVKEEKITKAKKVKVVEEVKEPEVQEEVEEKEDVREEVNNVIPDRVIVEKKSMKDILKIVGIVFVAILFLGFVFWSSTTYEEKEVVSYVNKVSYEEYMNLYDSETPVVGLIARDGCYYCQQYSPIVKKVASKYEINFNYIDTDTLTDEESEVVFGDANATGTPTTVILMGGKVVNSMEGYVEESDLISFLQENGIINE